MSEAAKRITIREIECRGLRSADFLTKNDVYVVFKVGSKKAKTKYISGGGSHVKFKDIIEMYVSDADLVAGIDFTAFDYDVGPDPDDLLGIGKLTHLEELKQMVGTPRQYDTHLMYKGRHRGDATCIVTLTYPGGEGPKPSSLGQVGGQIFNQAMGMQQQPGMQTAVVVQQQQQLQQQQQQPQYMTVTCPPNAGAGSQVIVQAPNGTRLQVVIPGGVGPGQQFRVPMPAAPVVHVAQVAGPSVYQQARPSVPMAVGTAVDVDGDGRPDYYIPGAQAPSRPAVPQTLGTGVDVDGDGRPDYYIPQQQPPPAYAAHPPQYGGPPPAYGAPPPAYGAPPPAYGAPPPQYGAPPPRYY